MNADIITACTDLTVRAGAAGFEIGYAGDEDGPVEEARWYAVATYRGARFIADEHRSPTAAALALAEKLLTGATCKCTQPITLSANRPGCRWRLVGARWEPGCEAAPIWTDGPRGDLAAMRRSLSQVPPGGNRASRRAAKRRRP